MASSRHRTRILGLLGPAFVAAVAYVDPGNVAANISAGSTYGYLLVWVLMMSNIIAMIVQYLSAKLGLVTGKSLPGLLGERMNKPARLCYWVQAEVIAAATDLAEIVGGAVALHLLFGLPLLAGGIITGVVSLVVLLIQSRERQRIFEGVVVTLLSIIALGFLAGLAFVDVDAGELAAGALPRFQGADTVLLAASMVGATVMPHAIYLHSALSVDRFGGPERDGRLRTLMKANRVDVVASLILAGSVNIGLLVLAAASLRGVPGTDTIEGAHAALAGHVGAGVATVFAIGLLASGLASSSVGAYAGDAITKGLFSKRVPRVLRRSLSLIPALAVLASGMEPTRALVYSQVILSVGIPFAMIPLVYLTGKRSLMGEWANSRALAVAAWFVTALIVTLNVALIVLTARGVA